ncbi:hypothetical protein I2494_08385 [Budviciaceae bacterium BWR-B9]|uniref:TnsA endonuclease N-terminal domain-containing protein n=1 Tax=Limnobaculum allomyrinae TaxID=2791986 RepID=A0ABS1IPV0_9GAMM|nr:MULTISPECIES: hypothetical protein [Limnobaculum]MBK5143732.1 hypothetical protein [Limnobaculum allomyrinae]MBV7693471.1 hypothetical protein [Limnobaculum sp. M2-1]
MTLKKVVGDKILTQRAHSCLNLAPKEIHHRVREPITRSRGKVRGQFPSHKMGRMIAWESQLERRACYLFEFSSAIQKYHEQPARFDIPYEGKIRRYTPDFELLFYSGEIWYVEIKPFTILFQPENFRFYSAVSGTLNNGGYPFIVITNNELLNPVKERNLTLLRTYQRVNLTPQLILRAQQGRFITLEQLIEDIDSLAHAYGLIAQGYLYIDLEQPITNNSLIHKDNHNEDILFTYRTAPDFR